MSSENRKYILEIDSTQRDQKKVSLKKDGALVDSLSGEIDIVESVQELLKKNNLVLTKDILEIVPNTGPGSFTGIKIGVTVANVLNWVLGNGKEYKPNYGSEPNITTRRSN